MTLQQVNQLCNDDVTKIKEFFEFMNGQAHGINDDGTANYYIHDVERFFGDKIFYLEKYKDKFDIVIDPRNEITNSKEEANYSCILLQDIKETIDERIAIANYYGVPAYIGTKLSDLF